MQTEENEDKLSVVTVFQNERQQWTTRIEDFARRIADVNQLSSLSTDVYSSLAYLADYKKKISHNYNKHDKSIKEQRAKMLELLYEDVQYKYTRDEKMIYIDDKMKVHDYKLKILKDHLDYLDDIYRLIYQMLYSIKNKIDLQIYLDGFK